MYFCRKIEKAALLSKAVGEVDKINNISSVLQKNDLTKLLEFSNSKKFLMRNYIEHKLYSENSGYYSSKNKNPIGRLENPLNFKEMRGISDYSYELNIKYPKSTWMTCPELLRPYFGYALGNYIDRNNKVLLDIEKNLIYKTNPGEHKHSNYDYKLNQQGNKTIKIFEIGCGMGGAIDSIMEYLKKFSIQDYRDIEYVGLELNPYMADFTRELLKKNHPMLFENGQIFILIQLLMISFY